MNTKKVINAIILSSLVVANSTFTANAIALNKSRESDLVSETTREYIGELPGNRKQFSLEYYKDKVYLFGGISDSGDNNTVEIFDLNTKQWTVGATMPTKYSNINPGTCLYKGNIYILGGGKSEDMYVYNIESNSWRVETTTPFSGSDLDVVSMEAFDNNIYILCGYTQLNYAYNLNTKTFTKLSNIPHHRYMNLETMHINNKIYCFGGYRFGGGDEVYDVPTDTWTNLPKSNITGVSNDFVQVVRNNDKIYLINLDIALVTEYDTVTSTWGGQRYSFSLPLSSIYGDSFLRYDTVYSFGEPLPANNYKGSIYSYKISKVKSAEDIAEDILTEVENGNFENITGDSLGDLITGLPDSNIKEELLDRYKDIESSIPVKPPVMEKKNVSSNIDIYIKSENVLSLSLSTNSIMFDDFSGVDDVEKTNAVNLIVNSSLPYKVNAYLVNEIQNTGKNKTMNKSILNIKANSKASYQTFTDTVSPIVLLDNQIKGNDIIHGIDFKLKGNIAHQKDVYKTTIKFEVEQK